MEMSDNTFFKKTFLKKISFISVYKNIKFFYLMILQKFSSYSSSVQYWYR